MRVQPYTQIEPLEPEWIWPGKIQLAETTLIAGDGGIGKGYLLADIAARITTGRPMPDGTPCEPGSVLMVTPEDDPNMAMTFRLRAAGADIAKVYDLTEEFVVPDSLQAMREAIDEISDVKLVVIDPLSAVSSIPLTSSNVRIRRQVMAPIQRLAKDSGTAVVIVHHTVKSGSVAGTRGITDAVRLVLRVSRAAQDERLRLVHIEKANVTSDDVSDVAYTVGGTWPDVRVTWLSSVPGDAGPVSTPTVAEQVLTALAAAGQPMTGQALARVTGASYPAVRVALTRMKHAGVVESPERGLWRVA